MTWQTVPPPRAGHPTPPVFDGHEDRNGTPNQDKVGFWGDYAGPRASSRYIYDDSGKRGGLRKKDAFVIVGDQKADQNDGDSTDNAASQLLNHQVIGGSLIPASPGGVDGRVLVRSIEDYCDNISKLKPIPVSL